MKYSGLKTDENLRFLKCPVCGNNEFSYGAEFCKICGSAIYNYCQDLYDENGYRVSSGCGKPNPGDSRFCEYCGNPTLLYKYLTAWEDEKVHLQKYGEDDSFHIEEIELPSIEEDVDVVDDKEPVVQSTPEQNDKDLKPGNLEDLDDLSEDLSEEFSKFLEDDFLDQDDKDNKSNKHNKK